MKNIIVLAIIAIFLAGCAGKAIDNKINQEKLKYQKTQMQKQEANKAWRELDKE